MRYGNGRSHNMSSDKDIFTKEIESSAGFGYALEKENRTLFEEMLDNAKEENIGSLPTHKGENFSAEALFLVLIFEQQKMINELVQKLGKLDRI